MNTDAIASLASGSLNSRASCALDRTISTSRRARGCAAIAFASALLHGSGDRRSGRVNEPKPSAVAKIARYSVAAALAVAALLVTIIGLAYGPLGEFVRGYDAIGWYGICVPKNTPTEVVNTLNEATNVALAEPKFKE